MKKVILGLVVLFVLCGGALAMEKAGLASSNVNADPSEEKEYVSVSDQVKEFPVFNIQTEAGDILIRLRPDLAPLHAERFQALITERFYDGVPFHRVIPNFMAQTGDPTGTGTGGSQLPDLKAEFSNLPFVRGTVGMARSQSPNSANSQFFICYGSATWLNGQYTVVGNVIKGMDVVDRIRKGEGSGGVVVNPDRMIQVRMVD